MNKLVIGKENGKVIYQEDNNGDNFYDALHLGISKCFIKYSSKDFAHVDSFSPFLLGLLEAIQAKHSIEITTAGWEVAKTLWVYSVPDYILKKSGV